jgi:hypothetical protein
MASSAGYTFTETWLEFIRCWPSRAAIAVIANRRWTRVFVKARAGENGQAKVVNEFADVALSAPFGMWAKLQQTSRAPSELFRFGVDDREHQQRCDSHSH